MISRERYLKLREMTRRYEAARKKFDPKRYQRGGGYDVKDRTIISAMAGHRDTTNEEKSQIEDFEWRMYPPPRYFGYYDSAMTKITGFMGNVLGRIIWKGSVTRAFGGKRQNITIVGTNNVMYAGVCNLTGGTYCRLKRIKGRNKHVLPNHGLALKPHFPYRVAKTVGVGKLSGQVVTYFETKTYPRRGGEFARVRLMGAGGESVGEEMLIRPWLLHKLSGPGVLTNAKKRKRPVQRKGKKPTYQQIFDYYARLGSRRNGAIGVGDQVKVSGKFLRSTGQYTGPIGQAKGIVTGLQDLGGSLVLATVKWDRAGVGEKFNVKNLLKAGTPEHFENRQRSRRNPKAKRLGSDIRVTMTAQDVAAFKRLWPGSGLPDRAIWFMFQSNGDLVDMSPGSERFDGPALAALSQDAQKFAGL